MANYRRLSDSDYDLDNHGQGNPTRQPETVYNPEAQYLQDEDLSSVKRLDAAQHLSSDEGRYTAQPAGHTGYDPGAAYVSDAASYTTRLSESTAYDPDSRSLVDQPSRYPSRLSESTYNLDTRSNHSEDGYLKPEQTATSPDDNLTFWQAVRKWPRLVLYCFGLTTVIIVYGYDSALVGSVSAMPEFKKVFGTVADGKPIIPAVWMSLWSVASNLGSIGGALLGGWLGDRIGRRLVLLASSIAVACGVTLFFVSDLPPTRNGRCGMFFAAEIIQGFTIGALTATTQTYMSEVVPVALRASVLATFPVFILVGQIAGALMVQPQMSVEGKSGYRISLATQYAFSLPPLIMSIILPESPAWLLRKKRHVKARAAFDRLLKSKSNPNTNSAFTKLQEAVAIEERRSKTESVTYLECFRGTDLRRTMIVIFAACTPDFFGLNLVGSAVYFLSIVGVPASEANWTFIAGAAVCLVSIILSFWTLTIFRRRQLFISTLAVITCIWIFIGVIGFVTNQTAMKWGIIIGFVLLTMTAGFGAWPASYVVGGETSSLRLRSVSQGLGWTFHGVMSSVFSTVMPFLYQPDAANLGAKTGFVYVGFAGAATVISYFYLPEMKGRSPAEVDEMFAIGLPARQFKNWSKDQ